jgi:hypothetical protein
MGTGYIQILSILLGSGRIAGRVLGCGKEAAAQVRTRTRSMTNADAIEQKEKDYSS